MKFLKKITTVFLLAGLILLPSYSTYAEEIYSEREDPSAVEEDLAVDSSETQVESSSSDIEMLPVVEISDTASTTPLLPELDKQHIEITSDIATTTESSQISSSTLEVAIEEIKLEKPVFYIRTSIEPVKPPSPESFRSQPTPQPIRNVSKVSHVEPPPFIAPIVQTVVSTSTQEVATTTDSASSTPQLPEVDPEQQPTHESATTTDNTMATTTENAPIVNLNSEVATTTDTTSVPESGSTDESAIIPDTGSEQMSKPEDDPVEAESIPQVDPGL